MANSQKSRTRVPVSTRTRTRAPSKASSTKRRRLDSPSLVIIGIIVLLTLWAVYVPLKNFFDGRAEITRLEASIEQKEREKAALIDELDRYHDEDFVEHEARRRLGVIKPGETAWRIIDPRMRPEESVTTAADDASIQPAWFEVLWDSIATPVE